MSDEPVTLDYVAPSTRKSMRPYRALSNMYVASFLVICSIMIRSPRVEPNEALAFAAVQLALACYGFVSIFVAIASKNLNGFDKCAVACCAIISLLGLAAAVLTPTLVS